MALNHEEWYLKGGGGFKEHFVKLIIVDILTPTKLDFALNPKILALTRVGGYLKRRKQYLKNGPKP